MEAAGETRDHCVDEHTYDQGVFIAANGLSYPYRAISQDTDELLMFHSIDH